MCWRCHWNWLPRSGRLHSKDGLRNSAAVHTVAQPDAARRLQAVLDLVERHRQKWSLPMGTRIVVSYEAGQDAFWIYRALRTRGIECYVIDPASIPVERQKRRAKTDRLDAIKLVLNLRAWLRGERDRMRAIHVPSLQDEASRHLMRDRGGGCKKRYCSTATACVSYWPRSVAGMRWTTGNLGGWAPVCVCGSVRVGRPVVRGGRAPSCCHHARTGTRAISFQKRKRKILRVQRPWQSASSPPFRASRRRDPLASSTSAACQQGPRV